MACEIMLHGGNTRKNTLALSLARAFAEIMEHQYKRGASSVELLGVRMAGARPGSTIRAAEPMAVARSRVPASAKL